MKELKMNFMNSAKTFTLIGIFCLSLAVGSFLAFMPASAETPVSVSIFASPDSISCGSSSTLTWDSANATTVTIDGFGQVSQAGSRDVSPSSTTTYVISGSNSDGGQNSTSVTISVNCDTYSYPTPSYGYPTPSYSTPAYSTPAYSTPAYSTPSYATPSYATPSYTYPTPSYGYPTPSSNPVSVTLTADDTSIDEDDSTILRWTSSNATSCTASGGTNSWSGSRSTSGTFNTGDLNNDQSYSITCINSTSTDSDSVTVRVNDDDNNNNDDDAPDVETRNATNVTLTSATLNGRVDGNGCSTDAWFEYSTDRADVDNDEETDEQSTGSGLRTFDERITGLRSNTTYYFRAIAENCEDDNTGSILSFRTDGVNVYPTPSYGYPTPSYSTPSTGSAILLLSSTVDRHEAIVPTLDNTRPRPGDEITYTVRYQNVGNRSVTSATLQLNLPAEVDYRYSDPRNPSQFGNTLIFNLGTISAGEEGVITVRVRVRENAPAGTLLNFPAILSYIDPSGQPQAISANVSAEVWRDGVSLGLLTGNVFSSGFFPATILGWLFLILLVILLAYLARQVFQQPVRQEVNHNYPPQHPPYNAHAYHPQPQQPIYPNYYYPPQQPQYPPQQPPQNNVHYENHPPQNHH